MTGHEDDILAHLEREIAADDPDLNGQAPEPQIAPAGPSAAPQPAPQQEPGAMDFAQEEPGTPVDAGAPDGAPAEPAPPPQPAQGVLSADQMAQKYHVETAQNQGNLNNAYGLKQQAATDLAGIQQARNDEIANADRETLGKEREFQKARDVVDNFHMNATRNVTNHFDQNVAAEEELAAKDPHDFWGNSSTVNKIGAIFGMIGAGLAHQDASKWFQQIIDNRVAETQRKRQIYQQIGHDLRYKQYAENDRYRTELGALNAKRVAAINDIQRGLKVNLNKYSNPEVQANLQATYADLELQKAKDTKAAIEAGVNKDMGFHQARLAEFRDAREQQELDAQTAQGQLSPQAAQDAKNYLPVAGVSGPGILRDSHKDFVKDQALTADFLGALEEVKRIGDDPTLSIDEKQQDFAVNKALSSGPVRTRLGVGANVTGEEGAYMNALLPSIQAFTLGKIGYGDFRKRIQETEDLVIKSHLNRFNAARHGQSEVTPQYPLYQHIQRTAKEQQAREADAQAIQVVEQRDAGNPQKTILDLEAIGTPTAKQRAQQILEMMRKQQGGIFGL